MTTAASIARIVLMLTSSGCVVVSASVQITQRDSVLHVDLVSATASARRVSVEPGRLWVGHALFTIDAVEVASITKWIASLAPHLERLAP